MKLPADLIAKVAHLESIDDYQLATVERFCDLLLRTNRQINLISRAGDVGREIERQLLLSLAVLPRLPIDRSLRWIDVGSGGGFPAIPLAIFRSGDRFDLVESVAKKSFFLERTSEALGLTNVAVLNCRIEELIAKPTPRDSLYNWMSVKAVAGWLDNLHWGHDLLASDGHLVTYKPTGPSEDDLAAIESNGFELINMFSLEQVVADITTKVVILKKM